MDIVVLHQDEIIGTAQPDGVDAYKGWVTGLFVPHRAFETVREVFAQAPAVHYTQLFRKFATLPEAVAPFCRARDALGLQLWRSDGHQIAARVVAIQRDPLEGHWTLVLHVDDDDACATIAEAYRMNAAEAFARYTHPWEDDAPAYAVDPAVIARVMQIFSRRTKNNPVLIADAPDQLHSTLAAVVAALHSGAVEDMRGWDAFTLDPRLVQGTVPHSHAHRLLERVLFQSYKRVPRVFFVIKEIAHLAQCEENILIPYLARGQMRLIGTATLEDYRQAIEKSMALHRRMQEIMLRGKTA